MAITQVSTSVLKDGAVTSAKLDTNIAIDGNLTVDTDTLYVDSANNRVGIGTLSPDTTLHTFGTGDVAKFETTTYGGVNFSRENAVGNNSTHFVNSFNNADSEVAYIKTLNRTGATTGTGAGYELQLGAAGSGYQTFYTNSIERMRITGGGSILVGTTNTDPTGANIQGLTLSSDYVARFSKSNGASLDLNRGGSDGTIVGFKRAGTERGTISITSSAVSYNTSSSSGLIGIDANTVGIKTNGFERMRITSGGNVGIGAANPSSKLHIKQSVDSIDGGLTWESVDGNHEWSIDANNAGNLRIYKETTPIARFNSSGNLGIGTTNPTSKLTVAGDILTTADSNDNVVRAYFSDNTYTEMHGYGLFFSRTSSYIRPTSDSTSAMYFGTSSATWSSITFDSNVYQFQKDGATSLYINSLGNVGIGTDNPSQKLSVEGGSIILNNDNASANYYLRLNKKEGYDGGILLQRDNSLDWQLANQNVNGDLNLYSYGTSNSVLRIQRSTGNVGIGAISPSAKLHVNGDIRGTIFYDTDNTEYYVNPSGNTVLNNLSFGIPGNGGNTNGRFLSIEGNTDAGGEGSSRIFFTEHNSTTNSMSSYGMSLGYRGGSTSVVGADGNTWTGLTAVGNGWWGMWGHDGSPTGSLIMSGPRSGAYVNFSQSSGVRAQTYYDLNDTNYFLDPAGNVSPIKGIDRGLSKVSGWVPAYGSADENNVSWSQSEDAVKLQSPTDSSSGMAFKARRMASGQTVRFSLTLKADVSASAGVYIRLYVYNGDLPDGKTHTSLNSSNSSPFVQEASAGVTNWRENVGINTSWTTEYYSYTAAADCYVSMVVLNWTTLGTNAIYVKNPDIQTIGIKQSTYYDLDNTAYYVNPASTSITDPSGKFAQYVQIGDSTTYNSNSGTWGARLNVTDNVHARIDVGQDANSMLSSWYAHTGNTGPIFGSMTAHPMRMMYNNSEVGYWDDYRIQHSSSVRAPIFYDSNDTIYYVDPNSTVQAANFRGKVLIGPNNSWSKTLQVGGNGREYVDNTSVASVVTTNGNLHLDSASGFATYINYYDGDKVNFGNGSNGIVGEIHSDGSARFPVFYDYNNTGYYVNPQSLSNMGSIRLNETISSSSSGDARIGKNYAYHTLELKGYGSEMMIGAGSSTMHVNYRYCNNTASTSQTPQDWYWRAGTSTSFSNHYWGIGYGVSSLRAPIFYDSDNTSYYLDPSGASSRLNYLYIGEAAYSTSTGYVGLKTAHMSGANDYMIISGKTDGSTYISGKDGSGVYIRGGGNLSSNQIYIPDGSTITATTSSFQVTGDVIAYSSSDERLKDNKKNINNALEKVESLNGVEFDWNDKQDVYEGHDIGVIAQEVEKIAPELVSTRDNGYKAVKYEKLVPLLIEAIKELSDKVKALENK